MAVSKYLNGKYSKQVAGIKRYIVSNGLEKEILRHVRESDIKKANTAINELCADIAAKKM